MKITVKHKKYLHVEFDGHDLYVYADDKRRYTTKTLTDLNIHCNVPRRVSISIESLLQGATIDG